MIWNSKPLLEGNYCMAEILPRDQHEFLEMHLRLNTIHIPQRQHKDFVPWGFSKGSSDILRANSNSFWQASNGNKIFIWFWLRGQDLRQNVLTFTILSWCWGWISSDGKGRVRHENEESKQAYPIWLWRLTIFLKIFTCWVKQEIPKLWCVPQCLKQRPPQFFDKLKNVSGSLFQYPKCLQNWFSRY